MSTRINSTRQRLRALLVEDSEEDALLLLEALRGGGYDLQWNRVETEVALHRALREDSWDIVFCDYRLPGFDAPDAIRALREDGNELPTIVVSGTVDENIAAETLRMGANDYLLKDNLTRLIPVVQRELRESEMRRQRWLAEQRKQVAEEALRQSEARLRQAYMLQKSLFNALPAHIALVDAQGVILEVNSVWGQFATSNAGHTLGLGIGLNYLHVCDRIDPVECSEAHSVATGLRQVLKGELAQFSLEYPCHAPTVQRWFRVTVTPVQTPNARHAVVMHIDITERKSAEEELQRIKVAVEFASDAIAILDVAGRGVYHNRTFIELLGYLPEDLNARGGVQKLFVHAEIGDEAFASVNRTGSWSGLANLAGAAGEPMELFLRMNGVLNTQGQVIAMIIVCTDMREQRRAQRKIEEQAALLDRAQDAIFLRDLQGTIGYWNKSAERLFGWTAEEAVGSRVQTLLHEDGEAYDTAMEAVLKSGVWIGELAKRTKDGGDLLVETRWTLLQDDFGDPKSILTIATDITEKRKLEKQFLRAQRMESIGTLASGIAHDLNNVLGPIIMAVDLFKLRLTSEHDRALLETMETSAQHGAEMVRQVLSFARGADGRRTLLRPKYLLHQIQKIARETFPKSISIHVAAPDDVWSLAGDETQIHQVILNLCVNARDAMLSGGRLMLAIYNLQIDAQFAAINLEARPGNYVVIEIADTGVGMEAEVMEKIFEPFFTTKNVGEGTGLGLSTSLGIVRGHGGFITVESVPETGTTFKVYLPTDAKVAKEEPAAGDGGLVQGNGECVLLIDDEAAVRLITSQTLETFGYRVMCASDGAEGLAKYAQCATEIDVVLTDIMMPILGGASTVRALTQLNPEVRIIVVSGLSEQGLELESAGIGNLCFLPKPYNAETLLRTVRRVLDDNVIQVTP